MEVFPAKHVPGKERNLGMLMVREARVHYSNRTIWDLAFMIFAGPKEVVLPGLIELYVETYIFMHVEK